MFNEYPKWVRGPGRHEYLAGNAAEEAAKLAEWAKTEGGEQSPPANALMGDASPKRSGWPKGRPRRPRAAPPSDEPPEAA